MLRGVFAGRVMWVTSIMVCGLWLAGCQKSTPKDPATETGAAASAEPAVATESGKEVRGLAVRPNVKTFPGRWGLVLTQAIPDRNGQSSYRDLCISLIEFTAGSSGELTAKLLASMNGMPEARVEDVKQTQNTIEFKFGMENETGSFEGQLVDGVVRGTLSLPGLGVLPAMLRPTVETKYEGWDPAPASIGVTTFTAASQSKDQPAAVLAAAKELRGSPLALNAYEAVFGRLPQFTALTEKDVREIRADFLSSSEMWGDRMILQAKLKSAIAVTIARRFPEVALEWLDELNSLPDDMKKDLGSNLKFARDQAYVDMSLRDIKSDQPELQNESYERLKTLLPEQRYNPEVLATLGTYAAKHEQPDFAMEMLADIVALPMLEAYLTESRSGQPPGDPSARELLISLWEEKHGSIEGFDAYIDSVYQRRLKELAIEAREKGPAPLDTADRKRTVLVELFTGTGCPPCVGADIAADILSGTYPPTDVVVIQHHQHIPAPDPLTNQDSEDRFAYYEGTGTPTAYVDGIGNPAPGVGGLLQGASQAYSLLRSMTDARMKLPAAAELTAEARVTDGNLKVTARGATTGETDSARLRLRLAVVENEVSFHAPNGIRTHHFVVREMLGGAKGIAPEEGRFEYELEMPLADIATHLKDYLQQFEAGRSVEFPVKPIELQALTLVAWIQNEETREILKTVSVPIAGTMGASASEDSQSPAEATSKDAPASATAPANEAAAEKKPAAEETSKVDPAKESAAKDSQPQDQIKEAPKSEPPASKPE